MLAQSIRYRKRKEARERAVGLVEYVFYVHENDEGLERGTREKRKRERWCVCSLCMSCVSGRGYFVLEGIRVGFCSFFFFRSR